MCEKRLGLIEEQVAAQKYRQDVAFASLFVFICIFSFNFLSMGEVGRVEDGRTGK